MGKFRKKPVVIEAYLWGGEYVDNYGTSIFRTEPVPEWLRQAIDDGIVTAINPQEGLIPSILIKTLEGNMQANMTDWIIKGENGELYPCKWDVFEKTYEPV